eukprot:TRINITY_DN2248_c0_g6_i1.p1 TRINITY_DN2248_c0_g6~~TRINITY_DN2248_c0_g6_i1.p1  ORF type:complete len:621 (+),score=148.93 TRINITY_DN2248_c0_g6_i1:82-1944(+)
MVALWAYRRKRAARRKARRWLHSGIGGVVIAGTCAWCSSSVLRAGSDCVAAGFGCLEASSSSAPASDGPQGFHRRLIVASAEDDEDAAARENAPLELRRRPLSIFASDDASGAAAAGAPGSQRRLGSLHAASAEDPAVRARRLVEPADAFTFEQRKSGAIILHVIGLLYMFLAIATVCDECFVPALEVIAEELDLSADVNGATFMAAGGSAPEFFTSMFGAVMYENDVGIGTIVGSAVFNVMFVIGACAAVAPAPLVLTWFPLARDASFYMLDLCVLMLLLRDGRVVWYEGLELFTLYLAYTTFMARSEAVEARIKALTKGSSDAEDGSSWAAARDGSVVAATAGTGEAVDDAQAGDDKKGKQFKHKNEMAVVPCEPLKEPGRPGLAWNQDVEASGEEKDCCAKDKDASGAGGETEEDEEESKPLSLDPPDADAGIRDWVLYVLSVPIIAVLMASVPDVRREGWRKLYPLTFVASIIWIAGFTWLMVWLATIIGETMGVKEHIMGLTILAAGTSVPDLLTSVIVAREGHGDMAVSSSIGSNIFDVTVGLPVPWIVFCTLRGRAVPINDDNIEVTVLLLLGMVVLTIGTIMYHGWVMTKKMGASMLFLYVIFLIISIAITQ